MLSIGDFAFNSKTGRFGKVIGYGHPMIDDGYETTLKVLIVGAKGYIDRVLDRVEEDLISEWKKSERQLANV